jgi:outer membrane protein assembly factor BamE (lipoprotein component of BamABCDE complex)
MKSAITTALCVSAPLALGACIINAHSHTERSGLYVSAETLRQIEPGRSRDYVLALLGEPTSRTTLDAGVEIWKWAYSETRRSEDTLIFVFSGENSERVAGAAYVEFQDGVVTKTWRD